MTYTPKDLERAQSLARTYLSVAELQDYEVEAVAAALAEVRREALEEAALTIDEILIACECGSYHPLDKVAGALRALKDRP